MMTENALKFDVNDNQGSLKHVDDKQAGQTINSAFSQHYVTMSLCHCVTMSLCHDNEGHNFGRRVQQVMIAICTSNGVYDAMFSNEGCSENENPLNIMIKCSKLANRSLSIQVALFCSILLVWCLMLKWISLLQPKFPSENYHRPPLPSKMPNSRRF